MIAWHPGRASSLSPPSGCRGYVSPNALGNLNLVIAFVLMLAGLGLGLAALVSRR